MTETNPYRSPLSDGATGRTSEPSRQPQLRGLLIVGGGAIAGVLVAMPLLMLRVAWAIALPLVGAALGALIARVGPKSSRGARMFALCIAFLVFGPMIGLSVGFLLHVFIGEPLAVASLWPYLIIGLIVGTAGAIGTALMSIP